MGYPEMPRIHPYRRDPGSVAGNCVCGWAEESHRHPHEAVQSDKRRDLCICGKPPEYEIHTGSRPFIPVGAPRGLDAVRLAVQRSRGGDAQHALAVIAAFNAVSATQCCPGRPKDQPDADQGADVGEQRPDFFDGRPAKRRLFRRFRRSAL